MTTGIALQPGLFQMKAPNMKKHFLPHEAIKSSGKPKSKSVYKLVMDGSSNTHLSSKQVRILTDQLPDKKYKYVCFFLRTKGRGVWLCKPKYNTEAVFM